MITAPRRVEIERQAARGFEDLSRTAFWLLRLCSLADACVTVGDRRRAPRIYELLQPFADHNATALTQLPFGPVALRLASLAALLERWDEAEAYFEIALERCDLLGARAVRARVLLDYARALRARARRATPSARRGCSPRRAASVRTSGWPGILRRVEALRGGGQPAPAPEARFVREGDFWTIAYEGTTMRLRDLKGLRYLAPLLAAPGPRAARARAGGAADSAGRRGADGVGGEGLRAAGRPELGPLVDPRAKEEYRSRIEELRSRARGGAPLRRRRARGAARGGARRARRRARARGRPRGAQPPVVVARRAGARERDQGDQDGDQADGARVARARRAPQPPRSGPAASAPTRLRARRRRAGSPSRHAASGSGTTVPSGFTPQG